MRAFVLDGYGAIADHVRLAEIADPVPGPGDVRIEIHAASLNPIDFKIAHGDLKRVSKYRLPRPFGFDASGVVTSVGARVTRFKPGDAVYARASRETIGTFAEKIALSQEFVALKPVTVSHAQAAALPLVGLTTLQGFSRVKARAGQRCWRTPTHTTAAPSSAELSLGEIDEEWRPFREVILKAANEDHQQRHQSVDELQAELMLLSDLLERSAQ
jgi:NADPH:quinone reductase-like Zn-dependent oxidoreductase